MAIRRNKNAAGNRVSFRSEFGEGTAAPTVPGDFIVEALSAGHLHVAVGCNNGTMSVEAARALSTALADMADWAEANAKPQSGPHFVIEYRDLNGATQTVGPFSEINYVDDEKNADFDTVLATYSPFAPKGKAGTIEKVAGSDFIRALPKAE